MQKINGSSESLAGPAPGGDLTDAQRQRRLEIADSCPVHKTLRGKIEAGARPADDA